MRSSSSPLENGTQISASSPPRRCPLQTRGEYVNGGVARAGSGTKETSSLALSFLFLDLKGRCQHIGVYTFSPQFHFIYLYQKKSEAKMLNLNIYKIWVTCVWVLFYHFPHFSLYFKIVYNFCWRHKRYSGDSPGRGILPRIESHTAPCPPSSSRKSVFSLTELGQMNGSVAGGGAAAGGGPGGGGGGVGGGSSTDDREMPAKHEIGEELIWTGRCPPRPGILYMCLLPTLPVGTFPTSPCSAHSAP